MGGSVSSGQSNDELIDNLVEGGLIKSQKIERVFRCVDRGLFFLPDFKDRAYRDLAWREGNIHISAPCVYTKVLENLELKENLSFLNIGSGTGYLSSMVGLILGSNGINHNVEIHKDLIVHAKERIREIVKNSIAFDDFEFCVPQFIHGDCMNINFNSEMLLYDRIYVGACVNQEQEQHITSLLKIGGILVMPSNDSLVKIIKLDENCLTKSSVMNVSFASLITSQIEKSHPNIPFSMPPINPFSLQEICRFKIRKSIRESIEIESPDYFDITREKSTFNKEKQMSFESSCISDTESLNEDEPTGRTNFPITRFERIFAPNGNNLPENSNNFEHQIRLMIYGHLLDAAHNSRQLVVNTNHALEESETNESLDELIPADNDSETESETSNSDNFLNDFNMSSQEETEHNDSRDSDLFDLFAENCRKAKSPVLVSSPVSSSNSSEEIGIDMPMTSKSLDQTSLSPESESSDEIDDGIDERAASLASIHPKNNNKIRIIKRKRNTSSGYSTSSNDFNSSLTEIAESSEISQSNSSENINNCELLKKSIDENTTVSNKNEIKVNLLREKILKLNVSTAMKNFLLYHRDF